MAEESEGGMPWGEIAAGGVALLGGLGSYKGQKDTNETNLTLGREQMQFQERMSNTAYQRAIGDMKAAGINPMLATKVGGASSPSGSMPQVENALGAGISGAVQGSGLVTAAQQIITNKAQTEQINATTKKIESETMEKNVNSAIRAAEAKKLGLENLSLEAVIPGQRSESQIKGVHADIEKYGPEHGKGGFAADVKRRQAEAEAARLGLSEARAGSKFYESDFGVDSPYIRHIVDIIKGISSAAGASRTMAGR